MQNWSWLEAELSASQMRKKDGNDAVLHQLRQLKMDVDKLIRIQTGKDEVEGSDDGDEVQFISILVNWQESALIYNNLISGVSGMKKNYIALQKFTSIVIHHYG